MSAPDVSANARETLPLTADLHLGPPPAPRRAKIAAFSGLLDHAPRDRQGLVVLGDLFDFWFSTATPYRRRGRLLGRIGDLHASGFPIRFVGGNHDFWLADYLESEFGVPTRDPSLSLSVGGRRIFAAHGDEMIAAADPGYRFLKRLLRNGAAKGLYRAIHPDIGIPLGRAISRTSRGYTDENSTRERALAAIERAFDWGHDAVVMGHLHSAQHLRFPAAVSDPGRVARDGSVVGRRPARLLGDVAGLAGGARGGTPPPAPSPGRGAGEGAKRCAS
jgi:UDP-2,3-diacylglucosamine hydrolase